jgi:hypothetical protein
MTAYEQGKCACQKGLGLTDNPYIDFSTLAVPKEYSVEARRWIDGYVEAMHQQ